MKLSTVFIMIGMVIISLYFLVEVSYYSSTENIQENRSTVPYLEIPAIGIDQSINNKSIDYGIYHEPKSAKAGLGTVALFGHRTFYGSPFLNLDKLKNGDNITVAWPGIGNVEYRVVNSFVVPASYRLSIEQGKTLFLITCYPLGSTKQRLIIQANQTNIYPFKYVNDTKTSSSPSFSYSLLFILIFLGTGLTLTYLYPVNDDKILLFITTLVLTFFLLLGYLFPVPPDNVTSGISNISSWFGG
ncbi:MAG: class E sortase [Methanobacterium sp.]|uniref:class E sortase n=1 Tax=Methanobacterium sp. TaxID=2164 RepID=UPI003D645A9B|nr:class E sortase [Methanobacterium sp.]